MVRLKGLSADCSPDVLLLLLQQVPHLGGSPGEVLEQVLLLLVQQVSATPEPVLTFLVRPKHTSQYYLLNVLISEI